MMKRLNLILAKQFGLAIFIIATALNIFSSSILISFKKLEDVLIFGFSFVSKFSKVRSSFSNKENILFTSNGLIEDLFFV